ncbi:hypothetical protein LZ31DRAFT_389058 [Colletotrichum somersetense]|nr:hypothetical protein LZ31DRAFT_389058 [Colletotrichum somersetense]
MCNGRPTHLLIYSTLITRAIRPRAASKSPRRRRRRHPFRVSRDLVMKPSRDKHTHTAHTLLPYIYRYTIRHLAPTPKRACIKPCLGAFHGLPECCCGGCHYCCCRSPCEPLLSCHIGVLTRGWQKGAIQSSVYESGFMTSLRCIQSQSSSGKKRKKIYLVGFVPPVSRHQTLIAPTGVWR